VFTKGFSLIKNENKMKITLVKTRNDRSLVMVVVAAVAAAAAAAVAVVERPQTPDWSAEQVCRALDIYNIIILYYIVVTYNNYGVRAVYNISYNLLHNTPPPCASAEMAIGNPGLGSQIFVSNSTHLYPP